MRRRRHQGARDKPDARISELAHDLSNILTALGARASLLRDAVPNLDALEDVDAILDAVESAHQLVARLVRKTDRPPARPVDLVEVARGAARLIEPLLPNRVSLRLELPDAPVKVRARRVVLERVAVNLLSNARESMTSGGTLTLRVEAAEPSLARLMVADQGRGMDRETIRRAFEMGFSTKTSAGDRGLGLASCRRIVQRLGGRIGVESQLGAGSVFIVELARVESLGREISPAPGTRVVVALLDATERRVAGTHLREVGCAVLEAATSDGARALLRAHSARIDVALLEADWADGLAEIGATRTVSLRVGDAGEQAALSRPYGRTALLRAVHEAMLASLG